MPHIITLNSMQGFHDAIRSSHTAIVFFTAMAYPPCKTIRKVYDQLARSDPTGRIRYFEADSAAVPDAADEAKVSVTPTFIMYRNGMEVKTITGAEPRALAYLVDHAKSH